MEGGEGERNSLQGKEEGGETTGGCFSMDTQGRILQSGSSLLSVYRWQVMGWQGHPWGLALMMEMGGFML